MKRKYLTGTLVLLGLFTLSTFTAAQEVKAGKVLKNASKESKAVESAVKTVKTAENVEKTVKAGKVIKAGETSRTAEAVTKAGEVNLPKVTKVNTTPQKVVASAPVSTTKVSNTLGGAELDSLTKGLEEAKKATVQETEKLRGLDLQHNYDWGERATITANNIDTASLDKEQIAAIREDFPGSRRPLFDKTPDYSYFVGKGGLDSTIYYSGKEYNFLDYIVAKYPRKEEYKVLRDAVRGNTAQFKTLFTKYPKIFSAETVEKTKQAVIAGKDVKYELKPEMRITFPDGDYYTPVWTCQGYQPTLKIDGVSYEISFNDRTINNFRNIVEKEMSPELRQIHLNKLSTNDKRNILNEIKDRYYNNGHYLDSAEKKVGYTLKELDIKETKDFIKEMRRERRRLRWDL